MAAGKRLVPKVLVQLAALMLFFGLLLFGAAGTWRWPSGWAFLALFTTLSLAVTLWLAWADPALLEERMKPPIQAGQKPWDRAFLGVLCVVYVGWLLLMGLDARRMAWSHVPLAVQVLGAAMIVVSYAGIAWVFGANSFAAPVIKVQAERRQTVISTGPYAFVRHPMYAFALWQFVGMPLMLGSLWSLALVPPMIAAIAWRTLGEEKMLREELAGYQDYARRVRWRYAPGIW
ncbi:isoprenylcysteine carboxylmethyltransferase family protein [Phenylobacterium sp.]|uniref:methyltransferase family protein n=1 Tax=Phenylobacterium sp. TaxID=1871053 RepID=UPI003561F32C